MLASDLPFQYDLVECSPEFAHLLSALFFQLSDQGTILELNEESLEALGKLFLALAKKGQGTL
jgi:hypothetical protein